MNIEIIGNKKYGILLSGGIDSAILLYLILKQNRNLRIQPFTIPKYDGSIRYALDVIHYMNNKFNIRIPDTIPVGNPDVHHTIQSKTAYFDIIVHYPEIDYIFMGTNQNPPEILPGLAPDRVKKSLVEPLILPFIDLYKTDILNLMYENNIEYLSEITHTCTEQLVGRCNICWQCNERKWSFDKIGKIDYGKK